MDTGNTAFVLISAALVALMTPGLAFFYGGLVHRRSVLTIMMQSFVAMGVISVIWLLFGYSLAFSDTGSLLSLGGHSLLGNFDYALMKGIGMEDMGGIPVYAFFAFQMMFAVITPALISGAFVDRMNFKSYLVFIVLWSILVYIPMAHWVWGGGLLSEGGLLGTGALDFAGGTIIHVQAGFAALASIFVLGSRKRTKHEPHNIPKMALGTALLWFGWFGFNAGSALGATDQAAAALVNTHIAAATAMTAWLLLSWIKDGRPSMVGALTGAVAGLVCITPAAGFVSPAAALVFGVAAALVGYFAVKFRMKMKWDDALDVWGVHGMAGFAGSILTGIFAIERIGGTSGLIEGSSDVFFANLWTTLIATVFAFVMTYVILKAIGSFMDMKVDSKAVEASIDKAIHGEEAYDF